MIKLLVSPSLLDLRCKSKSDVEFAIGDYETDVHSCCVLPLNEEGIITVGTHVMATDRTHWYLTLILKGAASHINIGSLQKLCK